MQPRFPRTRRRPSPGAPGHEREPDGGEARRDQCHAEDLPRLEVDRLRERSQRTTAHRIERDRTAIEQMKLRVRALSPQETLNRGYAVVQDDSGAVVRGTDQVAVDDELTVRLAAGELSVRTLELSERRPGQLRDD